MRIYNTLFIACGLIITVGALLSVKTKEKEREPYTIMQGSAGPVNVVVADPLEKVFQKRAPSNIIKPLADAAAGETVTFQLVVNSSQGDISGLKAELPSLTGDNTGAVLKGDKIDIGYLGYVKVTNKLSAPSSSFRMSPDVFYPDPIMPSVGAVRKGENQPIWISVQVPQNHAAGTYQGTVAISGNVSGKPFTVNQRVSIKVYPVQVKNTNRLWVSNWWSDGQNVRKFFSGNTNIPDRLATKMAQNGINSFIMNTLTLVDIKESNGKYSFDYGKLDGYIKSFVNAGLRKRIEGGFIGARTTGAWTSQYSVLLPVSSGGKTVFQKVDLSDPRVDNFYSQYFPSFVSYLKKNNYYQIFYQHVADEPVDQNVDSYNRILRMIKKYAPDMKTIDALQTDKVDNQLDVWVPLLSVLEKRYNSFRKVQQSGHELAFYTCWQPQDNYANRLIQMDLIKTRYLPWINFRYGLSGFLHWGFNQWAADPVNVADNVAGDAWIVYPQRNAILSSIRLDAYRDGLNDYALLDQLKQTSPDKASQIAGRMIKSLSSYDLDITDFRQAKRDLLLSLSQ